jgi:hypothetical protein
MADVQTVFGSINSIIEQTTASLVKIKAGQAQARGTLPTYPLQPVEADTTKETLSIVALVGVIVFLIYLLWKEHG